MSDNSDAIDSDYLIIDTIDTDSEDMTLKSNFSSSSLQKNREKRFRRRMQRENSLKSVRTLPGIEKAKTKIETKKYTVKARIPVSAPLSVNAVVPVNAVAAVNAEVPVNAVVPAKEKRIIIIDGNNVAFAHGQTNFSVKGIELCLEYFEKEGFQVKAICLQMRLNPKQSTDPTRLEELVRKQKVVLTPCKHLPGKYSTSYDDRFILEIAHSFDAVIISNDNYVDLLNQKSGLRLCRR